MSKKFILELTGKEKHKLEQLLDYVMETEFTHFQESVDPSMTVEEFRKVNENHIYAIAAQINRLVVGTVKPKTA